jgi:hypothetical protein
MPLVGEQAAAFTGVGSWLADGLTEHLTRKEKK